MSVTDRQTEKLAQVFTNEYMQKLFYFFLKKTGGTVEAEDLTSDTAICILSQLRKGNVPANFSAWVWKIARNRYCAWTAGKHFRTKAVSGADFDGLDVTGNLSLEEQYLHSEEVGLLRRELAFITSDYRNIVIAYYIENKKVKDIALSLRIPEGTVKTRLFKARKLLKEGIEMAREFGIKSYKPEEVTFAASGNQPSGLPWRAVKRKIPKNIILQAHNNPSTVEELSIELGIAMPYMEEEVALLTEAALLKKTEENKYITNFFIADKDCQIAVYQALRLYSKERSELLDRIITDSFGQIKTLNIMRNGMGDVEFKWMILLKSIDLLVSMEAVNQGFERPDGGNWGFIGYETQDDIKENISMGHNGNGNHKKAMFWAYKIGDYNLWERAGEMNYSQALLLGDVIKKDRGFSSLTEAEKDIWKGIENRFAHTDKSGRIVPDIAVFCKEQLKHFEEILRSHPLYADLNKKLKELYSQIKAILKAYSNPVLHEQLDYCASMFFFGIRMMTVHDEVEAGRLAVPQNPEKSNIAMYMVIK